MPITGYTIQAILSTDNPNEGRVKINQNFEAILNSTSSGGGGGLNITGVTYSEFFAAITGNSLSEGMFYTITDYRTCYDQPDFNYDGTSITTGNYKTGPIEPITVFATSSNTISSYVYQTTYPNDTIQYDWSWNQTEVTSGNSYGRITERIDEFNNRTDYDHRNILFKRYKLFTYRPNFPLNGTIQLNNNGVVYGTNTSFNSLNVGDVIYIPSSNPSFYQITGIDNDTVMSVSGDTINSASSGQAFYLTIEETNNTLGYFSFKKTNVKSDDFAEYTTFGDALDFNYAKNNYVGNYANNYTQLGNGTFILANNVFLEGQYESNKFGDYCYNNTFGTDNQNNVWGDYCYANVSTNDIDGNIIGHYFYDNLINVNFIENNIGHKFYGNKLLAENNDDFANNKIGDHVYDNTIYSYFYENNIGNFFYNNTIGDFGNLTQFSFSRNEINSRFYNNTIKQDFNLNSIDDSFYVNQICGNFSRNEINTEFFENTIISDSFSINTIKGYFYVNTINDNFFNNNIGSDFNNNFISNGFIENNIGNNFASNQPSNRTLFGWNDLTNLAIRTYSTFHQSLGSNNVGVRILGKEFIVKVPSTSQYFKFIFNQWSQNGLGGGFQYVRTEIDSSGNTIGSTITFTNKNDALSVDVIIPGVLEITRGVGGGAIYNAAEESGYSNSVSPLGTQWNSIYTVSNNGKNFAYNKIGTNFQYNIIGNDFGFGGSQAQGNVINDSFTQNTIGQFMYNNVIGNFFTHNTIGDNFESNTIKNYFIGNTIANYFESNEIGDYFGQNGGAVQNTIFNDFKYNKIGNFFGNEINFPTVSGGTGADGGNIINDGFQFNEIGDNCIYCMFDLNFDNNKIGNDFWFNFFGSNNSNNTIGNLFTGNVGYAGYPNPIGDNFIGNTIKNYAGFNKIGSDFSYNEIGNRFGNAGTSNSIAPSFNNNKIGNYFGDNGSASAGGNLIQVEFYGNEIGNYFFSNNIYDHIDGSGFHDNKLGNECYSNNLTGYSYQNEIDFGFQSNTIATDFFSNKISRIFFDNLIYRNFNDNIVQADGVNNVDFLQYVGNISGYTLTSYLGGVNGVYTNLTGTTDGLGINGTFDVVVVGGTVSSVSVNNVGQYYAASDTFIINGSLVSGTTITDDITITINAVTEPSVYENYNCIIFKNQAGNNRLSYYDNLDILNIKDINQ